MKEEIYEGKGREKRGKRAMAKGLILSARKKHGTQPKKETRCLGWRQTYLDLPILRRGNLLKSGSGDMVGLR
jgi:hypothetical protein